MSHGQASVERGFNDNNVVLKDNMGDLTVVARRFIKNYLRINKVEPYTIQISSELLKSVKSARHRYEIHLEEQKKSAQKEKKNVELVEVENELQTMTSQCSNLEETIATLNSKVFEKMEMAEKKNMMKFVVESNALKRKSDEKVEQLSSLRRRVEELQAKKKKLNS